MSNKQIHQLSANPTPAQSHIIPMQDTSGSAEAVKVTIAQLKTSLALIKADVGLSNVDNTSDLSKPVSTATQTALNAKKSITAANKSSHAFTVGMGVYKDSSGVWQRATAGANNIASRTEGIVISVTDANNFLVGTTGDRFSTTGLGLTPGITYFLSPTGSSGINYTSTEPESVGQVSQTLFQTNTANEATILLGQPFEIVSAGNSSGNFEPFLSQAKSIRLKTEAITIGSGSTQTIATLTGSGTITHIWQTQQGFNRDARFQIFVDGETLPSIDIDFGTLFLSHNGASTVSGGFQWDVENIHGEGREAASASGANEGGHFKYPIPFTNGAIIKVVNASGGISLYYAQITYEQGSSHPAYGYRLKSLGRSYTTAPLTFTAAEEKDLINTPTGSPGWMVYFAYIAKATSGSGLSFLERNIVAYIDGEVAPSYNNSGSEDFFYGSFYFQDKTKYNSRLAALSYFDGTAREVNACVDLLAAHKGIKFNDSFKLKMLTEGFVSVNHSAGFVGLFYTPATSAWGAGAAATVPGAPTIGTATPGNANANVTFTPPASDGGSAITSYTATSTPGSITSSGSSSPITVSGLTNGTAYTFTVHATNAIGNSVESAASNSVTPTAPTVPAAPTIGTATAGNTSATVSFTANGNGGSPITGFTATSTPGSITGTGSTSPVTVSGLTNGTAYTFTVHATNAIGNSTESAASNSVTPTGSTTDFLDTFTDTNGTNLTAHTPDTHPGSGAYTIVNGSWTINASGQLTVSGITNGTEAYAFTDSGRSNGTFECDITTGPTDQTVRGIMFRTQDANNTYILELVQNNLSEKKISLTRRIGGVNGTTTDVNIPSLTGNTTYHIKVILNGTSVICTLDNANTLNFTAPDATLETQTKAGLHIYYSTGNGDFGGGKWDNLKVSH